MNQDQILLSEKIDKIADDVTEIKLGVGEVKTDIALIKSDVNYHIKRTDLLESVVEALRKEMAPVKKHVMFVNFSFKAAGIIGGAVVFLEKMGWLNKILHLLGNL